jgi:cell division protein FtsB
VKPILELMSMSFDKKGLLRFSLFIFLFLGLVGAWLGFGERGFIHLYQKDKEREARLERIKKLEQENKELLEEIERIHKDKEYVESMGRRELGLVKEGEILYRFSKEKESAVPQENKPAK